MSEKTDKPIIPLPVDVLVKSLTEIYESFFNSTIEIEIVAFNLSGYRFKLEFKFAQKRGLWRGWLIGWNSLGVLDCKSFLSEEEFNLAVKQIAEHVLEEAE